MKLNFWQIVGIVLVIVAIVLIAREKIARQSTTYPAADTTPANRAK